MHILCTKHARDCGLIRLARALWFRLGLSDFGVFMIRKATLQDVDQVRDIAVDAYQKYVDVIGRKPAPMVADFRALIGAGCVYVTDAAPDNIVGFVVFHLRADHLSIENIAVLGAAAGKGLGRALLDFAEMQARAHSLGVIRLYTNEKMTDNLSLYPYLGFTETERRCEDGFSRVYFQKTLS